MTGTSVNAVAGIIQLAVAPVFLLAGIAGILNVLAARLARVVDRARSLEAILATAIRPVEEGELKELAILDRRMNVTHWAIGSCTFGALLVAMVVMLLFIAALTDLHFATPVALLFIGAMISVTIGLLLFLWEVTIATRSVRVNKEFVPKRKSRLDR